MKTRILLSTALALTLGLAGLPASAQGSPGAEPGPGIDETIQLESTPYGDSKDAFGMAQITSKDGKETFSVRAFGKFEDGQVMAVKVTRADGSTVLAGAAKFFLGSALLRLDNGEGSKVFPVAGLEHVIVEDAAGTLLVGKF